MKINPSRKARYEEYRKKAGKKYGFVYLLTCPLTDWSKIGWTLRRPTERLDEIRSEFRNGFDWELVGYIPCFDPPTLEEAFHRWFDYARVTDKREWFVFSKEDMLALLTLFRVAEDAFADEKVRTLCRVAYKDGVAAGRRLGASGLSASDVWNKAAGETPNG